MTHWIGRKLGLLNAPALGCLGILVIFGVIAAIVSPRSNETIPDAPLSSPTAVTTPSATPSALPTPSPTSTPTPTPAPLTATQQTLALLDTIPVKGRAPKTGYGREDQFGRAWIDVDRNGCDTRNDILIRDLTDKVMGEGCLVLTGTLLDPYTGQTIAFVRGQDTSAAVQIDHVVALMNAWETGAQQLTQDQRIRFANDPLNLMAVDGRANAQKGDGDAATWLPPQKSIRCEYVSRQVAVKAAYGLWVTQPERDAIIRVLAACP